MWCISSDVHSRGTRATFGQPKISDLEGLRTNQTRSSKEYTNAVWPTMSTRWITPTTPLLAIFKSLRIKRSQMKLVFSEETPGGTAILAPFLEA